MIPKQPRAEHAKNCNCYSCADNRGSFAQAVTCFGVKIYAGQRRQSGGSFQEANACVATRRFDYSYLMSLIAVCVDNLAIIATVFLLRLFTDHNSQAVGAYKNRSSGRLGNTAYLTGCSLMGKALKAGYNYVQMLLVRVQPSRLVEF